MSDVETMNMTLSKAAIAALLATSLTSTPARSESELTTPEEVLPAALANCSALHALFAEGPGRPES